MVALQESVIKQTNSSRFRFTFSAVTTWLFLSCYNLSCKIAVKMLLKLGYKAPFSNQTRLRCCLDRNLHKNLRKLSIRCFRRDSSKYQPLIKCKTMILASSWINQWKVVCFLVHLYQPLQQPTRDTWPFLNLKTLSIACRNQNLIRIWSSIRMRRTTPRTTSSSSVSLIWSSHRSQRSTIKAMTR